jgi:hypothetical protein
MAADLLLQRGKCGPRIAAGQKLLCVAHRLVTRA